ncbi:hypothetical protein EV697_10565 [Bisgaardia hudsonensis]|uniref:DUF5358 domain-containing protein n=1 Tax=Bisgaardia hudsonensis TaxID=109472 RepID=A0A4R2MV08_9PAST|nr:DUF5358 domain-containing protein [Bisgaardia hudsonensis]QLB13621.1 hypothetical protein A6A11_08385 [Bisgaardia hudsonensis]TCP11953.1 hypothetical protein EV697_10565 [Bisgaardia hudsonensis]
MLKKIILSSIGLLLIGCTSNSVNTTIPAEFANADYLLSNENAIQWAMKSHQVEECIYPNLTKIQREHFSKEDAYIHSQYVFFYPLEKVIGEEYVKMIQDDKKSMDYAQYQYKKFKERKTDPLPLVQCETLRKKARDDLAVVQGKYKNGMVEENTKETAKDENGVATNENKFFFDIIKWGAAFLL